MCVLRTNIWGPVRGPHYEGLKSNNYLFKRTFSAGTRRCPHNLNRPHFAGVFSYACPRKCATVSADTQITLVPRGQPGVSFRSMEKCVCILLSSRS